MFRNFLKARTTVSSFSRFFSSNKDQNIPRPPSPTATPSFSKKFSPKEVEKLMNPMGFLKEDEILEYEGVTMEKNQPKELKNLFKDRSEKEYKLDSPNIQPHVKKMEAEFGFKVKGPEPTRYGDWERKGRVSDF
jgi:Uncharacterized conserved small protein